MSGLGSGASVELLLPTHNGERYLPALLDSLFAQRYGPFTIVTRDDGSADGTAAIVADYARRYPGRIRILPSPGRQTGAAANFAALIASAEADFVFFCDQDDVWLPDKMAVTSAAMARLVLRHGHGRPLLVHTDLAVVDAGLKPLGASLHLYAGFDPTRSRFGELLLGNVVTGCTMLANRALYSLARPIPEAAVMYDHWLAQVAAALGEIEFVDEATILYRQHESNVIGVKPVGLLRFLRSVRRTIFGDSTLRVLCGYSEHARIVLARYGERLDPVQRSQAAALSGAWDVPRLKRYAQLGKAGLRKPRLAGRIALFLLLLRNRVLADGAPP
ncbi:MAG TPA: glycosyltransferase family 2 protein [Allosphingosinicella sp.]|jgi:glycosyltransferase involved in cell wall biosynthesis